MGTVRRQDAHHSSVDGQQTRLAAVPEVFVLESGLERWPEQREWCTLGTFVPSHTSILLCFMSMHLLGTSGTGFKFQASRQGMITIKLSVAKLEDIAC